MFMFLEIVRLIHNAGYNNRYFHFLHLTQVSRFVVLNGVCYAKWQGVEVKGVVWKVSEYSWDKQGDSLKLSLKWQFGTWLQGLLR